MGDGDSRHTPASLLGLRGRILAMSLLPLLLACLVLGTYFSYRGIVGIETGLIETGRKVTRHLAQSAARDMLAGQPVYLKRLFDHERDIHGALAVGLSDMHGGWWLVSGEATLLGTPPLADGPRLERRGDLMLFSHPVRVPGADANAESDGARAGRIIGQVVTLLRTTRIEDAKSEIITATFSVLSLLILLAGLVAWRLSTRLSRPLTEAIQTVKSITSGDLDARVGETSSGELRELEKGINRMAEQLRANAEEMETRIREATASLIEQKQAADVATKVKSRFLAAASHDLRQPLHTLMLLAGALRERMQAADPETARLVDNIENSTLVMGSLLNALLDLSRLDAGIIVARPECFPINELLDNIRLQFTPLAIEKGLRLRVHASDLTVFSDPALLERVVANLVANAIRYTEHGGVLVGARRVQRDWARIEVRDTGPGIAPENQERVFDEFVQLDNHEHGHGKGLGLGLSIVRRLVRLMGSGVELTSTPGRGSCFSVRASRCELPPGWSRAPMDDGAATLDRQPMVAFIDDDIRILEAMLMLFEEWGIELATGEDAATVIRDCRQLGRNPDVIISDYRLAEGLTGIAAIAELRAAFGQDTPAILVTGDTGALTMQMLDDSGIPVLHKPLKPAKLRAMLSHLLARRVAG
jgi:signal transduction histidine kinase